MMHQKREEVPNKYSRLTARSFEETSDLKFLSVFLKTKFFEVLAVIMVINARLVVKGR